MTLAEAREAFEAIRAMADDDEAAHIAEDAFRAEVLKYFAAVAPAELGELARIALSTDGIRFSRWYA